MANSHLAASKFSVPKIFNNKNSNGFQIKPLNLSDALKKDSSTQLINNIAFDVSQLKIQPSVNNSKSLSAMDASNNKISNVEWNVVDLSKALKPKSSQPIFKDSKSKISFEKNNTPLMPEQCDIAQKQNTIECYLDSSIIKRRYTNDKKVSTFGKVLCCNFRRRKPKIVFEYDTILSKMKRFAFTVPSPDDIIKVHLKK